MDLSADTLIRGRRCPGGARVTVADEPLAPDTPLWETSLCLHNHSPGGPEWGYDGSGPAQLALTVLLLVTDSAEAVRYYYLFKNSVLARHPRRSLDPPPPRCPGLARPGQGGGARDVHTAGARRRRRRALRRPRLSGGLCGSSTLR